MIPTAGLPRNARFFLHTAWATWRLRWNGIKLRWRGLFAGYYIEPGVTASLPDRIHIGRGCVIQRRATFSISKGGELEIGPETRIGSDAVFSVGMKVTLEANVLIAARCFIGDQNHAFKDPDRPVMHQGGGGRSPVVVGHGSWLGINVSILPGVTLGRNCVVGANSVVTRSFPDGSVLAGIPAKLISRTRPEPG